MIELYAIINEEHTMQIYIRNPQNRPQIQQILKQTVSNSKRTNSKMIKSKKIGIYTIYYFQQDTFMFVLGTTIEDRIQHMQNYLRVIADIFYENYDEKKFHIVLDRIIDQINRTQFGGRRDIHVGEDQEAFLVVEQKEKIHTLIKRRERESLRAYVVMTILFGLIVVVAGWYLVKKLY